MLALMRRQELDGFIDGLFGHETAIDLPEKSHPRSRRPKRDAGTDGGGARFVER